MALGKAITLFLIDGDPNGRIACELFNWTGKAYKIPRRLLKESASRDELHKTGVYLLFGRDENDPNTSVAYIGEAEVVYKRIIQHQDKDFWNEAVVFISKDENLNKAHVKFLEYEIHEAAQSARRAVLKNSNTPGRPAISELEQAVMTEFLENLKLLVSTLGYKIFEPLLKRSTTDTTVYSIDAARGAKATALVTNEGIVVRKGSKAATSYVPSTPDYALTIRERLLERGILVERDGGIYFTEDHLFSSPSTAAAVVMGRSANGRIEWKDKHGRSLKENEEG